MDFSKKQKGKFSAGKFLLKAGGILLLVVAAVLIYADFKIYQKKQELTSQLNNYKKQIEEIRKRNETLKEEIVNSDNPEYIEKIARDQENLQKPGEKVVSFIMPKQQENQENKSENFFAKTNWFSWLSQPWNWIKSIF